MAKWRGCGRKRSKLILWNNQQIACQECRKIYSSKPKVINIVPQDPQSLHSIVMATVITTHIQTYVFHKAQNPLTA
jgi:hypothetical protein